MNSALRLLLAAVLMLVLIAASCHQMAIAQDKWGQTPIKLIAAQPINSIGV